MSWTLEKIKAALASDQLVLKRLASHQDEEGPDPIYITTCRVYTLSDGDQIIGYYKEEKHGLYGCAIMSKITWDVAKSLGIENDLIPCEQMPPFKSEEKQYQGGMIQLLQEGISFSEYRDNPSKRQALIIPDQLTHALFISLILGMFDLHRSNIIIAPDGSPKFFDLTCSLPHSNHFLDRGGYLKSPFHCELLFLDSNSSLLSIDKRKKLQKVVETLKEKLIDAKKSLENSKSIDLPKHWLDPELAYNALEERVNAMLFALKNNQIIQVRDLAFRTIPEYKFICFLNYCILLDWRALAKNPLLLTRCLGDIEKPLFFDLLPVSIESMVDECVNMGLDPQKIQKCCQKRSLSETMSCIVHYVQDSADYMDNPIEENFRSQQAVFLIKSMKEKSAIDYKDWGENLEV